MSLDVCLSMLQTTGSHKHSVKLYEIESFSPRCMVKIGISTIDHDIEKLTRYVAVQVVWGPQAQGISLDLPRNRNHSFLTAVGISAPFQLQPFGSFQQIFGIKWNQ